MAKNIYGLALISTDITTNTVLDAFFPTVYNTKPSNEVLEEVENKLKQNLAIDTIRNVSQKIEFITIETNEAVSSTSDAYLRLHALSYLLVKPNEINLEGIFAHLPNNAWSNYGPIAFEHYQNNIHLLRKNGVVVHSIDKFPRLVDYIIPSGVRIADANRVRLGAYLSSGTTIMHEGFVNFNAGTLGTCMVEGRISQGVTIGADSDLGGGASIMGTLSGGGSHKVSIGSGSLLGANSGVGISIGDNCIVEAGLYITAGSKVRFISQNGEDYFCKALELSGKNNILFRRNSLNGSVEALERDTKAVELNSELHA